MPPATATKGVNVPPSIRTTNKLDFYRFCVLLASLKSQYRVLRRLFSLYSNPKSFVNFLLPPRTRGEGWGGVKNLRLLQGLLYLWQLGGYVPARYLFADRSDRILSQHCQAVIKNQTVEARSLRDLAIISWGRWGHWGLRLNPSVFGRLQTLQRNWGSAIAILDFTRLYADFYLIPLNSPSSVPERYA